MKTALSWTKSIIFAIGFTFIIRYFLLTPIVVEGSSMNPTLHSGNRLIANKVGGVNHFDIVVFRAPDDTTFIKRVIGLPGDHIKYVNDQLYLNGIRYDESYLDDLKSQYTDRLFTHDFDIKTLPATMSNVVPDGYYFLLGDNRQNSEDSRSIGFVAKEDVIGKTASIVFWPLNEIRMVQ